MTRTGGWRVSLLTRQVARHLAQSDDSGATLIIALMFVTVVSIVIASLLTFTDTSMRTTIAVRGEASSAAAADGAGQITLNTMRRNGYFDVDSGNCIDNTHSTLSLPGFYQSFGGTYSATVTCTADKPDSVKGKPGYVGGKPDNAILTLGTSNTDGITLDRRPFFSGGFQVNGDLYSDADIDVYPYANVKGNVTARLSCSGTITATLSKKCSTGGAGLSDPGYDPPTLNLTTGTVPSCTEHRAHQHLTFSPGLYTNPSALNSLTNNRPFGCDSPILEFQPGVYTFDFDGSWDIEDGYVVGGTPTGDLDNHQPVGMPGSCVSPVPPAGGSPGWTPPGAGKGVVFVFGGNSGLNVSAGPRNSGHVELCGSYSATSPPITVYGLKDDVKDARGRIQVHAGCTGCTVVRGSFVIGAGDVWMDGTTYIPHGRVGVSMLASDDPHHPDNSVGFAGVVALSFKIFGLFDSGTDIGPVSFVPPDPTPGLTVVNLAVYVCPGTSACGTTGTPNLRARVGLGDRTGAVVSGQRQVTVYSWNNKPNS